MAGIQHTNRSTNMPLPAVQDVISQHQLLQTEQNQCRVSLIRFLQSTTRKVLYIFLIVVTLGLITYAILQGQDFPDELWFIWAEAAITVIIGAEIILQICVTGCKTYFTVWFNYIDIIIFPLSVGALVLAIHGPFVDVVEEIEGLAGDLVLIVRNGIQFWRLIVLLKNHNKVRENVMNMIDFAKLAENNTNREENHAIHTFSASLVNKAPQTASSGHNELKDNMSEKPKVRTYKSPTNSEYDVSGVIALQAVDDSNLESDR